MQKSEQQHYSTYDESEMLTIRTSSEESEYFGEELRSNGEVEAGQRVSLLGSLYN